MYPPKLFLCVSFFGAGKLSLFISGSSKFVKTLFSLRHTLPIFSYLHIWISSLLMLLWRFCFSYFFSPLRWNVRFAVAQCPMWKFLMESDARQTLFRRSAFDDGWTKMLFPALLLTDAGIPISYYKKCRIDLPGICAHMHVMMNVCTLRCRSHNVQLRVSLLPMSYIPFWGKVKIMSRSEVMFG